MLKLILILISIFGAAQLVSSITTNRTESPEYTTLEKFESFEIRQYPNLILATNNMGPVSYNRNSGNGFRTVASYIFGGNESKQKISMTSPVMVEMADSVKMSFIMPSKYEMEDLPKPNNPDVVIHEEKSKILAVIRYGGFSNDKTFMKYKEKLAAELEKQGIKTIGPYMYFGYNPPYEVVNRRNEVAVEIEWDNK
jgi:hypothetical protein